MYKFEGQINYVLTVHGGDDHSQKVHFLVLKNT